MSLGVKKNDSVMVIAGKEKGKTGKIIKVLPKANRAIVERVNLVKRHVRPRIPQADGTLRLPLVIGLVFSCRVTLCLHQGRR